MNLSVTVSVFEQDGKRGTFVSACCRLEVFLYIYIYIYIDVLTVLFIVLLNDQILQLLSGSTIM